jgi:chromosome segregation ATPase
MQSTKVVNHILLGSVAFSISVGLGLIASRDLNRALVTGIITIPAACTGAAIAGKRRINQEKWIKGSLLNQIQELEEEEHQLYQSLYAATATRQQIEASITALQSERTHLLNRVSELHHQRNELYQEISTFQKQKQQQEAVLYNLQTQVHQLETQQADVNLSISVKSLQIQQIEARIKTLRCELDRLQLQIQEKQNYQKQLNQDLTSLESQKQDLGGEVYDIQTHIQVLQQRQEELNEVLFPLQLQKREVEVSLTPLQAKLKQLQSQISEKQKQQARLDQEVATLASRKQQLEATFKTLQTQIHSLEIKQLELSQSSNQLLKNGIPQWLPEEWQEWLEFTQKLSEDEQKAFKAILEQDAAELKRIADKKSIMLQVLIDSINDKALETFGDTLFISGLGLTVPQVHEEYSSIFLEPLMVYFKDLLDQSENTASVAVRTKQSNLDKITK